MVTSGPQNHLRALPNTSQIHLPPNYRGLDNPAGTGWLLQLCGGRHCQPPYTVAPILHPIPSSAPVWFSCHRKQKPTKSRKFQPFFTFFLFPSPFVPLPPSKCLWSIYHLTSKSIIPSAFHNYPICVCMNL